MQLTLEARNESYALKLPTMGADERFIPGPGEDFFVCVETHVRGSSAVRFAFSVTFRIPVSMSVKKPIQLAAEEHAAALKANFESKSFGKYEKYHFFRTYEAMESFVRQMQSDAMLILAESNMLAGHGSVVPMLERKDNGKESI